MASFNLLGKKFTIDNDTVKYLAFAMLVFYLLRIIKFFVEKMSSGPRKVEKQAENTAASASDSDKKLDKKAD